MLSDEGSGYTSVIVGGIDFVVEWLEAARTVSAGASAVASLSLGGGCYSSGCAGDAMIAAVDAAAAAGVAVTVAAGNDDYDACWSTPAASTRALTIGATDSSDNRAYFSNYGTCVDLSAPGVGITSAVTGSTSSYVSWSGTSMATPHVAGALAQELALGGDGVGDGSDAIAEGARARLLARAAVSAAEGVTIGDVMGSPDLLLRVDTGEDESAPPSMTPRPTTAPSQRPTAPTLSPTSCDDADGYAVDPYGDGCDAYDSYPSWCGGYDDADFTSNEMCCACGGGGDPEPTLTPSLRPTAPTPSPSMCDNSDGAAVDPYGDGCDAYDNYPSWCGGYDDVDFTSNEMCCVCGGGIGEGAPTSAPTSRPTAPTTAPTQGPTPFPSYAPSPAPSSSPEPTAPVAAPTAPVCPASCFGQTCDFWVTRG